MRTAQTTQHCVRVRCRFALYFTTFVASHGGADAWRQATHGRIDKFAMWEGDAQPDSGLLTDSSRRQLERMARGEQDAFPTVLSVHTALRFLLSPQGRDDFTNLLRSALAQLGLTHANDDDDLRSMCMLSATRFWEAERRLHPKEMSEAQERGMLFTNVY